MWPPQASRLPLRAVVAALGGIALTAALVQPAAAEREPIPTVEQVTAAHDAQLGVAARVLRHT